MAKDETFETFPLGDWDLQSGGKIYDAHIAFKTFGDSKLPPIVYPTWFSGTISDNFWLIGENMTLNPENYFIIIPALFGNGQSSSPSNQGSESKNVPFPKVSMYDNVRAQHKLVVEHFGITHLRAVLGWSMGGAQTFQWASQYTDFMDLAIPFCGAAKVALHNMVMLEGVKGALLSAKSIPPPKIGDIAWPTTKGESYRTWSDQEKSIGLKAFGRAYAGWGFSQAFYRAKVYETTLGYKDLEDFMVNFWEKWACSKDPENMLVMLQTWQHADISKQEPYNGDFELALASIKAKTLVLPGKTDLYFPPEDSEYEVKCMKDGVGELAVFPSIWGHWAGGPGDSKEDVAWLDQKLAKFFGSDELCIR